MQNIDFTQVLEYLQNVVNPASDHLAGLGINITEYTYRLSNHKLSNSKNPKVTINYSMHIFRLSYDPSRPNDYVKYLFENEFRDEDLNPYIQVNFSSVEGCATALVMF